MAYSFKLDVEDKRQRAVARWLEQQPNRSAAIRDVLIAHVTGDHGVSLLMVYDELAMLRREVNALRVSSGVVVGDVGAEVGASEDVIDVDLDNFGL